MKVIFGQIKDIYDVETYQFAKQLGAEGLNFNTPQLPGEEYWTYEDLQALVDRCGGIWHECGYGWRMFPLNFMMM